jgi:DNA-binding SARP family transcriptional activator
MLSVLLVRAGQVVSRDHLIDAVWGAEPPATAVNVVHAYVAGLRKVLDPGRPARGSGQVLVAAGAGYMLHVPPGQLDTQVADEHLRRARRARADGDPGGCLTALDTALALWRGVPLAGLPGPLAEIERTRLTEVRQVALEDRAEAALALGAGADLIGELTALAAEHPFRERLTALLMLALYQDGRRAEALAAYRRTHRLLADELGIDPGPDLRHLHDDLLHGHAPRRVGQMEDGARELTAPTPVAPRQLPMAARHFADRRPELRRWLTKLPPQQSHW